jgi:AmmeMemoRadiSam system protein A
MCFTDLSTGEKQALLDIARRSIHQGVINGTSLNIDAGDFSETLQIQAATFVTLHMQGQLRGCIGTLQAHQPLVNDVAQHAFDAAFKDPRFSPLSATEENLLDIHISILTPAEAMDFSSEEDLLRQLTPGEDGLILEAGYNRGTFLPSVWESLPEPRDFLNHLKMKAGLPAGFWSDDIKVSRYTTVAVP